MTAAAEWVWIGSTANAAYYIDASSIQPAEKFRKAWFRVEYASPRTIEGSPGKSYRSVKVLIYVDCKEKMSADIRQSFYAESDGAGDEVEVNSRKFSADFLEEPTPETIAENQIKSACSSPATLAKMRAAQQATKQAAPASAR